MLKATYHKIEDLQVGRPRGGMKVEQQYQLRPDSRNNGTSPILRTEEETVSEKKNRKEKENPRKFMKTSF